ncbi:ABC transporter [Colletotrichum sublineola]|uniref:Putative ABC transporter n=1 Tax=Colletotrichum sublineola TaxID=1173701 RepID=A0A066XBB5_COLSU|nr:ABC transporter [Colletotrichum sublineola]KDN66483.1 putative ABC transporter [Colletotrichum sublineola]
MTAHGNYASERGEEGVKAARCENHGFSKHDAEMGAVDAYLLNTTVQNISWNGIEVTVKDRETKQPKSIVHQVDGLVEAGEICALMGPSGCGKTTLLNVLADRPTNAASVGGAVLVNGAKASRADFRRISRFVEQEDALIGSLTVRETLLFTSRLASSSLPARERAARVDGLLAAFGLDDQADALIGTPLRKGISGGQKRRVGVASQLITGPRILFLDEPTSGLDSAASFEVVSYLSKVAKRNNLIVIASIHQPSTSTFNLFDKLLLLSGGKTHYFGPVDGVVPHYEALGMPIPLQVNPAEHLLELVNTDFVRDKHQATTRLEAMQAAWDASPAAGDLRVVLADIEERRRNSSGSVVVGEAEPRPGMAGLVATLLHRGFVKSRRDVVAYGVRLAMYAGLALMMGTVWARLPAEQASIIPLTNAIFFGGAFMSFMAVAYVPAFLEDRGQYVKERRNGLCGPAALLTANFLLGLPYLFLFALAFSAVSYWLSNFRPAADAFFVWVLWLFLDLLAAEGLVVLFASLFPSFVVSLALVAFANGLWMSVNGFMVPPTILNAFYRYVFHYWDYQKYVFEGMMRNEFAQRSYACGEGCQCMYQTSLAAECRIAGQGVLDTYGYTEDHFARNVAIMIAIIAGYRIAAWVVLKIKKN